MKKMLIMLLGGAALTFSACGFQPLHGGAVGGANGLSGISVSTGEEKIDFQLAQSLRDRMGENSGRYALELQNDLRRSRLGIRADDVASRYDMTLNVDYRLIDTKTGEVMTSGEVSSVSTFGAPDDPYGRNAASADAEARLADDAADRLILELSRYFKKEL